jgi:tetratricopeptide (TPR) repeat protein
VIDSGTWAFFHQRHLCHGAQAAESFLASALGLKAQAADTRKVLSQALGQLRLFPFLLKVWEWRDASPGTGVAAEREAAARPGMLAEESCRRLVAAVQQAPEFVTPSNWDSVHKWCPGARDTEAMPPLDRWFSTVLPSGTAFDSRTRLMVGPLVVRLDLGRLESLRTLAPYDSAVLLGFAGRKLGAEPKVEELRTIYGPLLDYDIVVMRHVLGSLRDDVDGSRRAYERMVAVHPDSYFGLGAYLADRGLDDDAAHAYALGLEKGEDAVLASNNAEWLVHYSFDRNKANEALAIATRAASVYSSRGLQTMGRLMERMGRYGEAVQWYRKIADRYEDRSELEDFAIRYERRVGDGKHLAESEAAIKSRFPTGLVKVSLSDFAQAPGMGDGLYIGPNDMTEKLRRFGMRPGDLIVALDGYRIRDGRQYLCVRSFSDEPDMTVIVWRGGKYVEVKGLFERRRFGPARARTNSPNR